MVDILHIFKSGTLFFALLLFDKNIESACFYIRCLSWARLNNSPITSYPRVFQNLIHMFSYRCEDEQSEQRSYSNNRGVEFGSGEIVKSLQTFPKRGKVRNKRRHHVANWVHRIRQFAPRSSHIRFAILISFPCQIELIRSSQILGNARVKIIL